MPLILIKRQLSVTDQDLKPLLNVIRPIVAQELTIPGTDGELNPDEIEVEVRHVGCLDQNSLAIAITIVANEYPERLRNLEERRQLIGQRLRKWLPSGIHGSLWVLLQPGSFETW